MILLCARRRFLFRVLALGILCAPTARNIQAADDAALESVEKFNLSANISVRVYGKEKTTLRLDKNTAAPIEGLTLTNENSPLLEVTDANGKKAFFVKATGTFKHEGWILKYNRKTVSGNGKGAAFSISIRQLGPISSVELAATGPKGKTEAQRLDSLYPAFAELGDSNSPAGAKVAPSKDNQMQLLPLLSFSVISATDIASAATSQVASGANYGMALLGSYKAEDGYVYFANLVSEHQTYTTSANKTLDPSSIWRTGLRAGARTRSNRFLGAGVALVIEQYPFAISKSITALQLETPWTYGPRFDVRFNLLSNPRESLWTEFAATYYLPTIQSHSNFSAGYSADGELVYQKAFNDEAKLFWQASSSFYYKKQSSTLVQNTYIDLFLTLGVGGAF